MDVHFPVRSAIKRVFSVLYYSVSVSQYMYNCTLRHVLASVSGHHIAVFIQTLSTYSAIPSPWANSIIIVTCRGARVTDIVSSRFDWVDWLGVSITIQLIITVHTFDSFLITNLSLLSVSCASLWSSLLYPSVFFCRILPPRFSSLLISSQSQNYITTDGQSASLSWHKAPSCRLVDVGRSLWREDGSIICQSNSQQ
jgi:hypothetical protein